MTSSLPKLTKQGILIRKAEKSDMKDVAEMIKEYADMEEVPKGPQLTAEDLERDGFDVEPPNFKCIVAEHLLEDGPKVVGYAIYFPYYSTWEGRSLLLEDLYVAAGMRRQGIGRKLFNAVAKEAHKGGYARLDFHALDWVEARSYYESLGATHLGENDRRTYFRLYKEGLEEYATADSF